MKASLYTFLPLALAGSAAAQISFTGPTNVPTGQQPDHLAFADLDGDGDADMAVTTDAPDKIEVFLNNGGALTPGATVFLPGGSSPAAIEAADMDGDGDQDLVVTLKNVNTAQVVLNQGGLTFTLGGSAGTGLEPRHIAVGDLNGDGAPDVVTSNRDGNNVSVMLNSGGALGAATNIAVGGDPRSVARGDVNGDGAPDLLVASQDLRRVDILTNNGAGGFTVTGNLSVGGQLRPDGVVAADLDGDGDMDVAAATSGNGLNFVSVFLNGGGGAFGPIANYPTGGVNPGSIAAADLDGDGDVDVATENQDSNSLSVLPNLGAGTFGGASLFATGVNPDDVTLADLDGNGGIDMAVTNRDSNSVSVYTNQNGGGGPTNYCVAAPNSAGPGATMSSSGSLSIVANTFTVQVSGAISGQSGVFFYGSTQAQVPFGDGFRCVGGELFRLNPPQLVVGGAAARLVDFTSGPASTGAGQILPGSTWNFQFWYRDPAGGPAGFNLSDGLSATFLP